MLLALASLTACATPEFDGPVALVTTDPHGGDAALLQGAVSSEEGELRWDGRDHSSGDAIELGGGGSTDTDQASRADYVPPGCEFDGVWFVATSSSSNPASSSRNAA